MELGQIGPLGHDFDNDELACSCGQTFQAHQHAPRLCPLVSATYNRKPKPDALPLEQLRVAMGLSHEFVASQVGVSTETARRAVNGDVGGKGMTARGTSDRVERFIRDMAGALGNKTGG